MAEVVSKIILGSIAYQLVRTQVSSGVWSWDIRARVHGDPNVYVYAPSHWRETEGEEQPFRPYDAFSQMTTYRVDPRRSDGWHIRDAGRGFSRQQPSRQFRERVR